MAKRNTQLSVVRTVIWIGAFSQVVISYGCKFKSLKFLDLTKNLDWCFGMGTRIYWLKKNLTKSGKIPSNGHEGRHLCYIQLWRSCNTFLGTRLLETFKGVFRKWNTRATPSRPTNAKPSLLCAALANLGHTNKLCFIFPFIALLTGNTVSDRDSCIVIGRTWSHIDWLAGPKIRIVSLSFTELKAQFT